METLPTPQNFPESTKATMGQNMSSSMNFQHKNPSLIPTTKKLGTSTPPAAKSNGMNVPLLIEQSAMQSEGDSPNLEVQPPAHQDHSASSFPIFGDSVPIDGKMPRNVRSREKNPIRKYQLKEKNAAIENVRRKLEQSETDLKAFGKALDETNATINGQETIINGLKSDAILLQDQVKSTSETASKMKEDHQKLKDELATATAHVKELEVEKKVVENARGKDKAQHLKALEDLRSDHQAEKKALEDSRSEQDTKTTESIKKLEAEKKAAESGRSEEKARYNEAATKFQNLQAEKDEMERKSSDLETQIFWLEAKLESANKELEESNSQSRHIADKNAELEVKKEELETTVELLEQSKPSADETMAKQAKVLTERRTEVIKLNKTILRVQEEKEALASLKRKRKILFPIYVVLVLLFLMLAVSLWKWYYG